MDETPDFLVEQLKDQLMAYFGDQNDTAAIAELREDIKTYPETSRILHDGIIHYSHYGLDCVHLVESCANRNVHGSQEEASAWLLDLFAQLFPNSVPVMRKRDP